LPNITLTTEPPAPTPKPPAPTPKPPAPGPYVPPDTDVVPKRKNGVFEIQSRVNPGNDI